MKYLLLLLLVSPAFGDCQIGDVIPSIRPGAVWTLQGTDYSGLQWQDSTQAVPTKTEVTTAVSDCQAAATTRRAAKVQARLDVKNTTLTQAQRFQALLILLDYDK